MNVILEGPDGSGKSTLARFLSESIGWKIVASKGPTRTYEELNARAHEFLRQTQTIFDRHCIISERIYGTMRGNVMTDGLVEMAFHMQENLIVYCRGDTILHQIDKDHDTPEHLDMIKKRHADICRLYDDWALRSAHFVYRKGDDMHLLLRAIKGALNA